MEIKQVKKGDKTIKFTIKGTNPAFVNGIRRAIQTSVKNLAVENVNVYENTSVMFNEMLAHRLGMLPIQVDAKTYKKKDKVTLMVEKDGPGTVYSKDIKSTDPKIEVVDKKIPIVKLGKNQRIKIEMDAVVDSGKTNSKWIPGIMSYNYDKDVFTVNIESFGGMEPKELLEEAVTEIKIKTEELKKALSKK
ncbi:DNA-directed RNA polymerase subunit D [Candidatus Micrarchaeota archaeon]|nr:DNA-directed RNA polymerase subunit D [Candidatus Micrarchaeota archaeon]MBU2476405.1 DNA-directed RNA polymerase subunit D [Candidatus Micrarchaeota archaeon]